MHTQSVDIEFDPAKAASNLKKHRVSFADAEQALRDLYAVTVEDPDSDSEQRLITLVWALWGGCSSLFTLGAKNERALFQLGKQVPAKRSNTMRKEYDFSKGKRGPVIASTGKTRITIMLDNDVIKAFRTQAESRGTGYQTAINEALRAAIRDDEAPLTAQKLREILRQELNVA